VIFNPTAEKMPVDQLADLQGQRLAALCKRVAEKVPFYRKAFADAGVDPASIRSIDDITRLPFTVKNDLRDHYPFGLLAVPLGEVMEVHASSGTTGKPTVVAYTRKDIELWSEVMARCLALSGATADDFIQNAYGYGLFTGVLCVHYGGLKLGATVLPISAGQTARQIQLMHDFGTTVITCTPSYSLYLAEESRRIGLDVRDSKIKVGILGAEPWSQNMRKEIEEAWGIDAIDIYGLSEIIGPGVANECLGKCGLHVFTDVFYAEIIQPGSDDPVEPGEPGELVITTLTKEALPLIRYRCGDIVTLDPTVCPHCGRTSPRMSKVRGRTDDMLIIRGVNVFPSQIEHVLMSLEETEPHYLLVVDREAHLDTLEVQVEVREEIFTDEIKGLEAIQKKVAKAIADTLGLSARVKLVEPQTIERSMGKAKRVIDNRKL